MEYGGNRGKEKQKDEREEVVGGEHEIQCQHHEVDVHQEDAGGPEGWNVVGVKNNV